MQSYTLQDPTQTTNSNPIWDNLILRDSSSSKPDELEAIVRSGLYFATLATEIDTIREQLKAKGIENTKLETIIKQLLKLQESHILIPKPKQN